MLRGGEVQRCALGIVRLFCGYSDWQYFREAQKCWYFREIQSCNISEWRQSVWHRMASSSVSQVQYPIFPFSPWIGKDSLLLPPVSLVHLIWLSSMRLNDEDERSIKADVKMVVHDGDDKMMMVLMILTKLMIMMMITKWAECDSRFVGRAST